MTDFLKKLYDHRLDIRDCETQIDGIMPFAITEAMDKACRNNVVYEHGEGKIVLSTRKQYLTPKDDIHLERLASDIDKLAANLAKTNKEKVEAVEAEIAELKKQIGELELLKNELLVSNKLIILKARFKNYLEDTVTLKPILNVFLPKR